MRFQCLLLDVYLIFASYAVRIIACIHALQERCKTHLFVGLRSDIFIMLLFHYKPRENGKWLQLSQGLIINR